MPKTKGQGIIFAVRDWLFEQSKYKNLNQYIIIKGGAPASPFLSYID